MKLEFADVRIVGDLVIADHPTLPSIDVTRYLTRGAVDALVAAEAARQREERQAYMREMAGQFQSEALYERAAQRRVDHADC